MEGAEHNGAGLEFFDFRESGELPATSFGHDSCGVGDKKRNRTVQIFFLNPKLLSIHIGSDPDRKAPAPIFSDAKKRQRSAKRLQRSRGLTYIFFLNKIWIYFF